MLLLDSEALSALAHGPAARRDSVRALITAARRRNTSTATASAVLAEVVRGRATDAGVFAMLKRESIQVHEIDVRVAVRAGQLLGATRSRSDRAIDAFLVAVGDLGGGAIIATGDAKDISRFANYSEGIAVAAI